MARLTREERRERGYCLHVIGRDQYLKLNREGRRAWFTLVTKDECTVYPTEKRAQTVLDRIADKNGSSVAEGIEVTPVKLQPYLQTSKPKRHRNKRNRTWLRPTRDVNLRRAMLRSTESLPGEVDTTSVSGDTGNG